MLLAVEQEGRQRVEPLLRSDPEIAVWWATRVECQSAVARLRREKLLDVRGERQARRVLDRLLTSVIEIQPSAELRESALRLLDLHPLRAADALQLAAALECCGARPRGFPLVSTDDRLRDAALRQGFDVLPDAEEVPEP